MSNTLTFEQLPNAIQALIEKQNKFQKDFEEFKNSLDISVLAKQKEVLTTKEVCELLQINRTTLWSWANKGIVTPYGMEKRRYFKYSELMLSLIPLGKIK